jgi:hypothetical protein
MHRDRPLRPDVCSGTEDAEDDAGTGVTDGETSGTEGEAPEPQAPSTHHAMTVPTTRRRFVAPTSQ